MPRRLLILGGGPVGVELGRAVARMGGDVVIVEGMHRLLAREPERLGDTLADALRADGIELHLGRHATVASQQDGDYVLALEDGTVLRGDRLLVATGRRPRVADLGLDTVGIEAGRGGIAVDARMRAANGCGRSATSPASGR